MDNLTEGRLPILANVLYILSAVSVEPMTMVSIGVIIMGGVIIAKEVHDLTTSAAEDVITVVRGSHVERAGAFVYFLHLVNIDLNSASAVQLPRPHYG